MTASLGAVRTILVLLVLASFAAMPSAGVAAPNGRVDPFCARPALVDYERPLRALPPAQGLPESGEPPFAPAGVRVTALLGRSGRLVFLGHGIRYQIRNEGKASVRLGWIVKVRVSVAAPDGSVQPPISESTTTVGELGPRSFWFAEGAELASPGVYRVEIAIFDEAKQPLGAYSEYLRAVQPVRRVRLGINRRIARPGSNVKIRVENRGTLPVDPGHGFEVAHRKQGRWIRLPEQGPVLKSSIIVLAGRAGSCETVRVPRQAPPGLYRVRKFVETDASRPGHPDLALTATFRVRVSMAEG